MFIWTKLQQKPIIISFEVWGSYLEPIKSPTCCQRLATVATLMCGTLAQSRGLVTPERILSEYNEDLIFFVKTFLNSSIRSK